jgi:hypothetical protein
MGQAGPLSNAGFQREQEALHGLADEFRASLDHARYLGTLGGPGAAIFLNNVAPNGVWDYKARAEYSFLPNIEAFGNFAFGNTAAAWADGYTNGLSNRFPALTTNLMLRGAGAVQQYVQRNYNSSDGNFLDPVSPALSNYGDSFEDQVHIQWGAEYYFDFRKGH